MLTMDINSLINIPAGQRDPSRLHQEMIHCPQMSSIKYHQPSHKLLLTSREPGHGLALIVFSPPVDTDHKGARHWLLGGSTSCAFPSHDMRCFLISWDFHIICVEIFS